jgi:hypothetical protein
VQKPAAQLVPGYRAEKTSETDQQDVRHVWVSPTPELSRAAKRLRLE